MSQPQRILVTGASRGLGRALVEHFLQAEHRVLGCARGESPVEHPNYHHQRCDVTDEKQTLGLLAAARKHFGGLDVLINNAGTGRMLPLALTPPETARRVMDVNYLGTFLVTHAALRLLRKSAAGRIVNFTSVAVPLRLEGESVYAASKAAIEALTRSLAKEIGPLGITCNAIGPSPIRTDLIKNVPEDKLQALIDKQAIPHWATPADVAHTVDFLIHPDSRMVTGQVLYLGGVG